MRKPICRLRGEISSLRQLFIRGVGAAARKSEIQDRRNFMYSEQTFELLCGFVGALEETDLTVNQLIFEIEGSAPARKEFGTVLQAIVKGFMASDAETQNIVFLTGLSNGLIDKKMIAGIAEYARRNAPPSTGAENLIEEQ